MTVYTPYRRPLILAARLTLSPSLRALRPAKLPSLSMLLLKLALLLRRRCLLVSFGSCGLNPLARANRLRISVRLTTPVKRPDMVGTEAAVKVLLPGLLGVNGAAAACGLVPLTFVNGFGGGTRVAGVKAGVGGPEDDGEGSSTIHMRCERVATSLATVWARVESGLTWKTGYESAPSFMPRSERITLMKWMQEERRSGREAVEVRSCC